MRRSNTQSLGEVIREFIKFSGMERRLKETDIVQSWEALLGKTIASYTRNITIKNRVLEVEITSAVVKNELFMMRDEIRRKMNERAGEELVATIRFK
ncbi:MAG: hypothetical protein CR996_01880 [Draconibacterium sp.]|nr:MAG: hypothetical protein CR996_01880 [Draconibacterium sp.]PIF06023.1 MAG: hypothetical protein CSA36_03800 [Draconibacterium sp.]